MSDSHVPTFRFAPSPNGELHIGHALSALTGWRWAKRCNGRFLLRIEDIDTGRSRDHFVEQIFDDLRWLGIEWEDPVLRQSEHFDVYRAAITRLQSMGVLYPCFATRAEIMAAVDDRADWPRDPDGAPIYPGLHKMLSSEDVARRRSDGIPFALRLDMQRAISLANEKLGGDALGYVAFDESGARRPVIARPERWGDVVIVRKDVPASYHLAVVVDDAWQGVTHVTRGQDLEAATDVHRILQVLLGLPAPLYHHHRLIVDSAGRKFSKSSYSTSIRAMRERGMNADDVLRLLS